MKAPVIEDFAALIGIDWADNKHDICEVAVGTKNYQWCVISSKPQAMDEWAMSLKKRYPDKPVAVVCELKKGPLIYALSKYEHIVIFTANPSTVAKYRDAFSPSGAKDDPKDALIQTEILAFHMDKLFRIDPDSPQVRALAQLVENRRTLVQNRVDLTNRITATLKNYFPQALDWFGEKDTIIFCDFLTKWPSLPELKKARKQTFFNFLNQHNSRYPEKNENRFLEIKAAHLLTDDPGVVEPNKIFIEVLVPQLKCLIEAIARHDREIAQRYRSLEDHKIFDSLPGIGDKFGPRLLVAFGSNRDRYQGADEVQKYTGIAPVIEQSGKKKWTHWRYSCPTFLRQTFVEWAGRSIRYSFWAKAYYEQQISKGKPHNTVIRSLAFKWIRIVFRCWKTKTLYDESIYLNALKKRNSPLLKFIANA